MPSWQRVRDQSSASLQALMRLPGVTMLCLSLGGFASQVIHAADAPEVRVYRYVDSRGVTVIDRQGVPPDYIAKGYEVLNLRGRVIEVVPPAPTAEQLRQARVATAQASADALLLHQYRSVDEVDRARARKAAELDALIGIAEGNIQGLAAQQASLQGQAADQERSGRSVPQPLIDQLSDLRERQRGLDEEITRYQDARKQSEADFATIRAKVQALLNQ